MVDDYLKEPGDPSRKCFVLGSAITRDAARAGNAAKLMKKGLLAKSRDTAPQVEAGFVKKGLKYAIQLDCLTNETYIDIYRLAHKCSEDDLDACIELEQAASRPRNIK